MKRLVPFAVLAALLLASTSCQRADADTTVITITLNYNGGNCTQTGSDGSSGVTDVSQSQNTVTYKSQTAVSQFAVSFGTCPFSSCPISSTTGAAVSAGQPKATAVTNPVTTYNYSSVSFGSNQICNNPQQLGVRVRP
ncbi:MAG TPA: hypothetical protein VKB58_18560 [Terriglobales bacterium]|nr:hypothetical protein [Terriglobales bacterium]